MFYVSLWSLINIHCQAFDESVQMINEREDILPNRWHNRNHHNIINLIIAIHIIMVIVVFMIITVIVTIIKVMIIMVFIRQLIFPVLSSSSSSTPSSSQSSSSSSPSPSTSSSSSSWCWSGGWFTVRSSRTTTLSSWLRLSAPALVQASEPWWEYFISVLEV